jgi:hypothetical protein
VHKARDRFPVVVNGQIIAIVAGQQQRASALPQSAPDGVFLSSLPD